jgi:hypothetical protein
MVRIVFRASACQAEEEGDGAQTKGRQRDSKPERRMPPAVVDVEMTR